ncbi:MAG: hypothetical protein AAF388_01895 [Bacteroidota bacterium]
MDISINDLNTILPAGYKCDLIEKGVEITHEDGSLFMPSSIPINEDVVRKIFAYILQREKAIQYRVVKEIIREKALTALGLNYL